MILFESCFVCVSLDLLYLLGGCHLGVNQLQHFGSCNSFNNIS